MTEVQNTEICIQHSLTMLLCNLRLLSDTQFYDYTMQSAVYSVT